MSKNRISQIIKAFVISMVMLACSLGMSSSSLAVDNPPAVYRANIGRITIEVDPRVELIGIVFRLAGSPEFNDGTLRPYVKAIEKHFGDFDNHPVIKMATELRKTHLMSCDGPMSLAVHIDRNYRLRKTDEEWPSTLDYRWEKQETAEFLEKLRQFAAETKFDEFFKAQRDIYETGIQSCKDLIGPLNLEKWLVDFFGVKDCGDLKLVLGFVNGFYNYGVRFTHDQTSEKYAIVGMRPFDAANTVIFRPKQLGTTVHEFCHSFANPVVEKYMDRLQPAGERLFAVHGPAMRMGGYQKWESVMHETAVRACVMSFVRHSFELMYLDYFLKDEVKAGFVWTEDAGNFLKTYESNRDKYPTFESFFPEFVDFLNEYSKKAAQ
ncbi:MAG: DUF4932 domain-containing protein [Planctomycetes bacterium]|nr:DUF4932 domain-containing protein [Planctomycetota bacterium]MBL7143081.1 DUF4932 domain-containing protein [Phycisphaerae bacterium]